MKQTKNESGAWTWTCEGRTRCIYTTAPLSALSLHVSSGPFLDPRFRSDLRRTRLTFLLTFLLHLTCVLPFPDLPFPDQIEMASRPRHFLVCTYGKLRVAPFYSAMARIESLLTTWYYYCSRLHLCRIIILLLLSVGAPINRFLRT
jgi:hypothetical protein